MKNAHPVIGAWRAKTVGAPFPYHMFAFHSDGTMQQSNPPAGNTETSDTAGMGVWQAEGKQVKARFEEFRLDFKTGQVTRGVVDFDLRLEGDKLTGSCAFNIYDPETGEHFKGPLPASFVATRVTVELGKNNNKVRRVRERLA